MTPAPRQSGWFAVAVKSSRSPAWRRARKSFSCRRGIEWKPLSYRVAASIDAFAVGGLWTGSSFGGIGIKVLNALISSTLYDLHETAWGTYGPPIDTGTTEAPKDGWASWFQ
ncbi:MAG: DUF2061 domain-containing protein [Azospirillum sp.]|nr:DUF2061 domain-containing protein [Azospirillum sp.]